MELRRREGGREGQEDGVKHRGGPERTGGGAGGGVK